MPTPIRRQFIVALVLAGCSATSDPLPEPMPVPLQSRISRDPPRGTAARMDRHFTDSILIKDAVIAGKLDDAKAPARRLLQRTDPYPESWRPFMAANVRLAGDVLAAEDIDAVARAVASLAHTCGDCHAAVVLGARFTPPSPPPAITSRDPRQRMRRHQWAADRMWEAMVGHSDVAWTAAAAALADPELARADFPPEVDMEGDPTVVARQLQALGARAAESSDWDHRVRVYGQFLATCAVCHEDGR